jgi:hypothetical protein
LFVTLRPRASRYAEAVKHARNSGALLWSDDAGRRFAARPSAHEHIRDFIKGMKDGMIKSGLL